jgi:hypothetical protein
MNRCLYCDRPRIGAAIFCDECRASLLKRQHPPDLMELEHATRSTWTIEQPITPLTDNDIEAIKEKTVAPVSSISVRSTRKSLSTRARTILVVFIMVAAISLVAGGILLAANTFHDHTISLMDTAAITGRDIMLSPHANTTTGHRGIQTSVATPGAGTPTLITGTGTGTSTPGAGVPTPVNTSTTPASTPTVASTAPSSCVLQAAPTHLSFTATSLQPNPPGQSIILNTTGSCGEPVTWNATADASWIQFSSSTGSDNGSGTSVTVYAHSNGLFGFYTAHITFTAVDSNGVTAQSSPQTITVTLTVKLL